MYVFLPLSFGSYHLSSGIPADSGHRLFVIPHFSFDPRAFRGSGNSSHRRHPFVINNRLPSGEFYSFVFFFPITIQLCLHKNHNNRFLAVAGADQRENKLEFSLRGNEGGWVAVTFLCQWAGKNCSVSLRVHLVPQMKSFSIQIIALDQKQEGFYILFIQKYETNYYLESSSCLVGKFKRILLPAGINTLLLFTYLFCLLIRNKVLIRMEVLIWKEIKLKEYQGPEKISCKCYGCFVGSTPAYVNQGFSFVHSMWCLAISKTLALEWCEEKWKNNFVSISTQVKC